MDPGNIHEEADLAGGSWGGGRSSQRKLFVSIPPLGVWNPLWLLCGWGAARRDDIFPGLTFFFSDVRGGGRNGHCAEMDTTSGRGVIGDSDASEELCSLTSGLCKDFDVLRGC